MPQVDAGEVVEVGVVQEGPPIGGVGGPRESREGSESGKTEVPVTSRGQEREGRTGRVTELQIDDRRVDDGVKLDVDAKTEKQPREYHAVL